jgi:predicted nucleic acid-binding protein
MPNSWVCVDANVVIKLVVEEVYSSEVRSLWHGWVQTGMDIAAPALLRYEVTSVLRKQVTRGLRTNAESLQALKQALAFEINYLEPPNFHQRAYDLAERFNRPATYDTHYLALAEYLDCEFWTADERLVNTVHHALSWVKWIGKRDNPTHQ